jgi:hypothetical protein
VQPWFGDIALPLPARFLDSWVKVARLQLVEQLDLFDQRSLIVLTSLVYFADRFTVEEETGGVDSGGPTGRRRTVPFL